MSSECIHDRSGYAGGDDANHDVLTKERVGERKNSKKKKKKSSKESVQSGGTEALH